MRQGWTRVAALAAAALTFSAGLTPAQASAAPGWRVAYQAHYARQNWLMGVAAVSRSDAWAIGRYAKGNGQIVLHWNGRRWRPARLPAAARNLVPTWIYATSPADVWITGYNRVTGNGQIFIWDGVSWRQISDAPGATDDQVAVLGPSNAWTSDNGCSGSCTLMYHWTGATWVASQAPFTRYDLLTAGGHVLALANKLGWDGNTRVAPALYQLSGSHWIRRSMPKLWLTEAEISATSLRNIWVSGTLPSGRKVLCHWNGRAWSRRIAPKRADGTIMDPTMWLTADGHGGAWLGPYAHWTGRKWVNYTSQIEKFSGFADALAAIPGTRSTWLAALTQRHGRDQSAVAIHGKLP